MTSNSNPSGATNPIQRGGDGWTVEGRVDVVSLLVVGFMAGQPTTPLTFPLIIEGLINPLFLGGTLEGGRLTTHEGVLPFFES